MTLATHAVVGAAAASLIPTHPFLGFIAGFVSHFAIDAIPHWEYSLASAKIDKDNLMKCHLCGECAELSNGEIKINETSEDFIFEIESFGQLSCDEMVTKALDELGSDVEEFINLLKK